MERQKRGWGRTLAATLALASIVLGAACASPAPTPPTAAPSAPTGGVIAKPAAAASPAAASAGQPAAAASTPGNWDKVLADARSEGTLVVNNAVNLQGQAILDLFQGKFPWLKLQITALQASAFAPRVLAEQRNGLYAWDLLFGAGFNTAERTLAPADAVGDLRPMVADMPPDVADDSKWANGFRQYRSEKNFDSLVTDIPIQRGVWVNRALIPESQLSKVTQLADPAFKGKLVIYNPTVGNAGSQALAAIMANTDEAFVRKLLVDQDPVIASDANQASQFVAEGRYPIAIGVTPASMDVFQSQGVGKQVEALTDPANAYVRVGGFTLLKNAQHPNAVRVFMAWFLSQEGQLAWNKSAGNAASRRLDVPIVNPDSTPDLKNLGQYKVRYNTPDGDALLDRLIVIASEKK